MPLGASPLPNVARARRQARVGRFRRENLTRMTIHCRLNCSSPPPARIERTSGLTKVDPARQSNGLSVDRKGNPNRRIRRITGSKSQGLGAFPLFNSVIYKAIHDDCLRFCSDTFLTKPERSKARPQTRMNRSRVGSDTSSVDRQILLIRATDRCVGIQNSSINSIMPHSRDLTEEQWRTLDPLIPKPKRRRDGRGRPWKSR